MINLILEFTGHQLASTRSHADLLGDANFLLIDAEQCVTNAVECPSFLFPCYLLAVGVCICGDCDI